MHLLENKLRLEASTHHYSALFMTFTLPPFSLTLSPNSNNTRTVQIPADKECQVSGGIIVGGGCVGYPRVWRGSVGGRGYPQPSMLGLPLLGLGQVGVLPYLQAVGLGSLVGVAFAMVLGVLG